MSSDDDFGFSFELDEEAFRKKLQETEETALANLEEAKYKYEAAQAAKRTMFRKIYAFLNKLKQQPEKAMINWPNRVEQIDKFIAELEVLRDE